MTVTKSLLQTFLNALKYRLVYIWKRPEYQILKDNDGGSKSPKSEERGDITSYLPSAVECDAKPKSIKSEDLSFQFLPISIGHDQVINNNRRFFSRGRISCKYSLLLVWLDLCTVSKYSNCNFDNNSYLPCL